MKIITRGVPLEPLYRTTHIACGTEFEFYEKQGWVVPAGSIFGVNIPTVRCKCPVCGGEVFAGDKK